jgi:release factor glutamine methyltransferase
VLGTDASPAALEVARDNARRVGARGTLWAAADGLAALGTDVKVDAVVANLPYVADGDRRGLAREVLDWEPAAALFAGPRGDEILKRIVGEAPHALRPGGLLALEVGQGQAPGIRALVRGTAGLEYLALYRDHAGIERGVLALAE